MPVVIEVVPGGAGYGERVAEGAEVLDGDGKLLPGLKPFVAIDAAAAASNLIRNFL
jgi:hypothetical protein